VKNQKTLYTYCEQVGRRGKDYETKRNQNSLDWNEWNRMKKKITWIQHVKPIV
jgi:hypothetical protein